MRSDWEENSTRNSQKNTRLIIDANILFAALITNNKTSDLIFSEHLTLYAPPYLFEEFNKYKTILLNKTKRDEQTFITLIDILKRNITIIDEQIINKHLPEAKNISPDPKDTPYFAAAIAKKAIIWSNDKQLKQQEKIKIITTKELLKKTSLTEQGQEESRQTERRRTER